MSLLAINTLNLPSLTQSIVFNNPSQVDEISYASNSITYPIASSFVLSQADFALFYQYSQQFYNSLIINFPNITQYYNIEIPVCLFEIQSLGGPNLLNFTQTSTASPVTHVYTITFDRVAKTATFAARASAITITMQEYLLAFSALTQYANQVTIA